MYMVPVQYVPGSNFVTETTYTSLRQKLASVLDRVANDREVVIIRRKGSKKVALVPADELIGLLETAHLLRSPKNAQRLLTASLIFTAGVATSRLMPIGVPPRSVGER